MVTINEADLRLEVEYRQVDGFDYPGGVAVCPPATWGVVDSILLS